jgi:DNA-binding NarL/FixJ family response regulator
MAASPRAIAPQGTSNVQRYWFEVNAIRREGHPMEHFDTLNQISNPRGRKNDRLTEREREVVVVVSEGKTNKEIGRRLSLAEGTVKVHLHHIYQKLGIANRTALAIRTLTNTF